MNNTCNALLFTTIVLINDKAKYSKFAIAIEKKVRQSIKKRKVKK